MDEKTILEKFTDLFTNYNLIDAYINNSHTYNCIGIRSDHLIFSAFTWVNTPEGYLWATLDREWKEICKEHKKISFQKVIEALKEKGFLL